MSFEFFLLNGSSSSQLSQEDRIIYEQLCAHRRQARGCHAVVKFGPGQFYATNSEQGYHAEETIFRAYNRAELSIQGIYIDYAPCHSNRYPGHGCEALFTTQGRPIALSTGRFNCRFLPGLPVTPVFFVQPQVQRGRTQTMQQGLGQQPYPQQQEALRHLPPGFPPGLVAVPPGDPSWRNIVYPEADAGFSMPDVIQGMRIQQLERLGYLEPHQT